MYNELVHYKHTYNFINVPRGVSSLPMKVIRPSYVSQLESSKYYTESRRRVRERTSFVLPTGGAVSKFIVTLIPIIPHVHRVTVQSDLREMIDKEDPVAHIGVRVLLVI